IVDLVDRGRSLGAVAAPRGRGQRGPLELADLLRAPVDPRQQPAGGRAVEADGGDQQVALLDAPGPLLGVVLAPVVPLLGWREGLQPGPRREAFDAHASATCCGACT